MDKGIGFRRKILLAWLDAAASACTQSEDLPTARAELDTVLAHEVRGPDSRRKAIDVLVNIWFRSREALPELHREAVRHLRESMGSEEWLWLHYGLTLVTYPFFREVAAIVGQAGRQGRYVSTGLVRRRIHASRGQLGSFREVPQRAISSMRDWGLLEDSEQRYHYGVKERFLRTEDPEVELWLLACALRVHPAEELPYLDLVRLPELFPFQFTVGLDDVRRSQHFLVDRQGGGWDSVRLAG